MYVNSPGSEIGSFTLTFLGKKVGRHHSVAPAGKKCAWVVNNSSTCPEDPAMSALPGPVSMTTHEQDLPGSVPHSLYKRPKQVNPNSGVSEKESLKS
ncbi:uncharacterized protein si:dkey-96l17.6 [Nerophis ophidion]|uniref:uncharacterized protein si:dkey-96l17.6 n=1 Tax=Nerophis ophidion TaxID=159077 RepID=UPI002ADF2FFE|nr:uncharacterized protein si:dkey-96l17.6 [Nerophis ophidion]XP_061762769.1 uncharacterized protein si:dkey-96l17.6 [Nerophis ophidion]